MHMSRHAARERALQTLYQIDLNRMDVDSAVANTRDLTDPLEVDEPYFRDLLAGVLREVAAIDAVINAHSDDWEVERMPVVDRNILRIGLYELLHEAEIPHAVAMDEAVLLSKAYGTDDTPRFVNGVMAGVVRTLATASDATVSESHVGGADHSGIGL
jgi:N utilization substance protein B